MHPLSLIYLPVLVHIAYTDFRFRKLRLLALLALAALSIVRFFLLPGTAQGLSIMLLNLLFLVIIFGVIYVYSILRKLKIKRLIGEGDLIFLLIAVLNFAPVFFLFFVAASSLFGILYFLAGNKNQTIPFAGVMSVLLMLSLVAEMLFDFSVYNDVVLLNILV